MKKVLLELVGLDGNAFAVIGAFRRAAKKCGWTKQEIDDVTKDAMSGDYNHLLAVIANHCTDEDEGKCEDEA